MGGVMQALRQLGAYLGFVASPGAPQRPEKPAKAGRSDSRMRRWGRGLLVRGLANAAVWPGRWALGLVPVLVAVPGPWWLASMAITPKLISPALSILMRSDQRSFVILTAVSSRVKTLKLARRVRRRWRPEMIRLNLTETVTRRGETRIKVPQLAKLTLAEHGVSAHVDLTGLGLPVDSLAKYRKHLASEFRARSCSVRETGSGLALLELQHTDPLAQPVALAQLPEPRRYLHVVAQVDESGRGVEQPLPPSHLLVGATRSGKSTYVWAVIDRMQEAGIPLRLRVFDPKRQEFAALADAAYDYESDPARWPTFLGRAYAAMRSRQASLAKRGIGELRYFTERDPLDVMLVDELLTVVTMRNATVQIGKSGTMKADDVLAQYASQMLAAGYGLIALAQLGQKETLGQVRDLLSMASCLRVPPQSVDLVDVVLGPGASNLFPAHQIPVGRRYAGIGYTRTPDGLVVRSRAALLDDEQRQLVVKRTGEATAMWRGDTGGDRS